MNSLHPIIADKDLPACLKQKLVFGDRGQINALNTIRIEIEKQEAETQQRLDGEIKKFSVTVEFEGYDTFSVWATSKKHAVELAKDMEIEYGNLVIEGYSAVEVIK